jgi:hypothetical protein
MESRLKVQTVGHSFATGGPRSLRWHGVGWLRQDAAGWAGIGPESRKGRRGRSRAGGKGAV